jgi:carbamoyl-phosphate synthase small subunit
MENGQVFPGQAFGAAGSALGEVVFTTGMTGYLETLTDPSYYGQIVVQTFPLIGNYGVIAEDFECERIHARAYIVKHWCAHPSNFRGQGNLDDFLRGQGVVGLSGVDTRALTRLIRDHGTMNGKIVTSLDQAPQARQEAAAYAVRQAVENACGVERAVSAAAAGQEKFHVALWDFGAKQGIVKELKRRGCRVSIVPHDFGAERILALQPHGVMLSNGPGDPADNHALIAQIARLAASRIPLFGICLGHQLLALAQGALTSKLPFGHRGANQPVKDVQNGRIYITSQNHGYAVDAATLPAGAAPRFINANDGTCEGIDYKLMPAFSVQFHPEGRGGPQDTGFLFDRFLSMIEEKFHAPKT